MSFGSCNDHQINPRVKGERCETCKRIATEAKIARICAKALVQSGYNIKVNDGEEDVTPYTGDLKVIEEAMFSTDEDYFFTLRHTENGQERGWVRFIYGNDGWDVINDYTTSLEHVMSKVNDYAERQE